MSGFKPEIVREGDGVSRLLSVIEFMGYNPGGTIHQATVVSEHPNFKVRIDADTIDVGDEIIICNPQLKPYSETVTINGQRVTIEHDNKLKVGARVLLYEVESQQLLFLLSLSDE